MGTTEAVRDSGVRRRALGFLCPPACFHSWLITKRGPSTSLKAVSVSVAGPLRAHVCIMRVASVQYARGQRSVCAFSVKEDEWLHAQNMPSDALTNL